ncbi:hypothetical protein D3C76_896620 [compost metagenome]
MEFFASFLRRHQLHQRLHSLATMARADIVDGHVQPEVMRIDAQFAQFIGRDQQVQRQLLIAKVVANHLWQIHITAVAQRQL